MKTYRCPKCGKLERADNPPFCFTDQVQMEEITEKSNFFAKNKKKLIAAAVAIIGIVSVAIAIATSGGTDVDVKADKNKHTLKVVLSGEAVKDYEIRLTKADNTYDMKNSPHASSKTFAHLYGGPYTLHIKYIGKDKKNKPELAKYTKNYTFPEEENTSIPVIQKVSSSPTKLSRSVKVYTITVKVDTTILPLKDTEFSMDNNHWQTSAVFNGVQPGTYKFYARNRHDSQAITESPEYTYDPYTPYVVTNKVVNVLVTKIANGDLDAEDKLTKICGSTTKVTGLESEHISTVAGLCTWISTNGDAVHCSVHNDSKDPEKVLSISVSR